MAGGGDKAAGRFGEDLAHKACRGYLLGFHKVALVNDDKTFTTLVKAG